MSKFAAIIDALAERGWIVCPDFFSPESVSALSEEARLFWEQSQYNQAGVGQGSGFAVRRELRGDHILWLDPETPSPAQAAYLKEVEELRRELNQALFLNLVGFEAHFAVYPPGSFYRKHLDRFAHSDERTVSVILYLNAGWQEADGGQLRLYDASGAIDVPPRAGTLAVFRSDTIYHEVLPARRDRYSLTGWLRRRSAVLV